MAEKNNHQSQCILFGPSCKSKDFEYRILKTNPDLVLHWLHNLIVACCLLLRQSVVAFNLRSVNFKFFSLFLHFWTPTYIRKEHFSPDYIRFGATLEPQAENFSSSCGHHQSTGYHVDTEANKSLDTRLKQVFFHFNELSYGSIYVEDFVSLLLRLGAFQYLISGNIYLLSDYI